MGHVTPKLVKTISTYKQPPTETTGNYQASHNEEFKALCASRNVAATGRQYRKWQQGRGQAAGKNKLGKAIDTFGNPA